MLPDYKVDVSDETQELTEKLNKEKLYIEFVKSQEQGFMRFINCINSILIC